MVLMTQEQKHLFSLLIRVGTPAHLIAVRHVPEAGQCVNPDVDVFVLNGLHGQLQRCGEVTAARRQLWELKIALYFLV